MTLYNSDYYSVADIKLKNYKYIDRCTYMCMPEYIAHIYMCISICLCPWSTSKYIFGLLPMLTTAWSDLLKNVKTAIYDN